MSVFSLGEEVKFEEPYEGDLDYYGFSVIANSTMSGHSAVQGQFSLRDPAAEM